MAELQPCPHCKHMFPPSTFVGVRGGVVQSCETCHNRHKTASQAIPPAIGTLSMHTPSHCHSSSPPLSGASPLPARTDHDPGSFATVSSVLALEARFSRCQRINGEAQRAATMLKDKAGLLGAEFMLQIDGGDAIGFGFEMAAMLGFFARMVVMS
ncbi:uncharacterized protein UBRO_20268 [Ustilago bromivora]|uniref:Uncharacterized protein n=1 Tax=Ustilago bromivora TaxID=307758 RepID=A0A1K0H3J3_9BASI|nr:uncharacterized protein UBRO_20268 [Ustilago bromivora]